MQIEDSSDESEKEQPEEPESKFIKFDREITPEPREENTERMEVDEEPVVVDIKAKKEKENESKTNSKGGKACAKAKRWVNRTYEDDEGFISEYFEYPLFLSQLISLFPPQKLFARSKNTQHQRGKMKKTTSQKRIKSRTQK